MTVRFGFDRRPGAIAVFSFLLASCANRVFLQPAVLHPPPPAETRSDFTTEPHLAWSLKLSAAPSAPMVSFGSLLAVPLKNRSVWFVNKGTGKRLGVYDISGVTAGVVFDGRENLLIAEESGSGELISYSLVEGETEWRFALNEAGEVPILKRGETDPAGTVLAINRGGWVYALRADNGKPLWNQQLAPLSCPPVAADTFFYLADFEGKLNAIANGKIVHSQKRPAALLCLETAGDRLFAGGGDSSVCCFSTGEGKLLWEAKTDGKVRSLALGDSLVFYASTAGTVTACSAADGAKRWERKLESLVNAPLLAAGGAALVGTVEGRFLALSEANGEILWERRIPGGLVGRPVLEGNTLFLATTGRRVLAFRF
ncbi:MAG: PQQ-binding-like beta-propeller repeat protein [candidate division Zixibacteria bacterium]|nr:PQQ-binding-like beta-propeller repeat protein [candidate division Zixibacteria bacterium]